MERFARQVLGYHGCLRERAEQLFSGKMPPSDWSQSDDSFEWLGRGVYFWEFGPDRALEWAKAKAKRDGVGEEQAAVVGAMIDLSRCLDLNDVRATMLLAETHALLAAEYRAVDKPLPLNTGVTESDTDRKRRELDCLVVNTLMSMRGMGKLFGVVRAAFPEGQDIYPGAMLRRYSHIQLAVRDSSCILGVFRPNFSCDER